MNLNKVDGKINTHHITVYALSTCPHCKNTKKYLQEKGMEFNFIDVDLATRDEKREITQFLRSKELAIAFPVIIIDDTIIQGFKKNSIDNALEA